MADRNQLKINFYVLKNAPCQILTNLESRILKIGQLVQKLLILQEIWEKSNFEVFDKCCNF